MTRLRKSSKILIGVTAVMTVCAAIAMNSAFSRIEANMHMVGGDFSHLQERYEAMKQIDSVLEDMQTGIDDASKQLDSAIEEQKNFSLRTQAAKKKNEELDWAIKCLSNDLYTYKEREHEFSIQKQRLLTEGGPPPADAKGRPQIGEPPGNHGFFEKLRIFIIGMPERREGSGNIEKLREMFNENPERQDIKLLADIEEVRQALEASSGYCERILNETRQLDKASQSTGSSSAKKSSGNSGTTYKQSGNNNSGSSGYGAKTESTSGNKRTENMDTGSGATKAGKRSLENNSNNKD